MRPLLLSTFGALLMVLVGASCAKGSSFTGTGGDGGSGMTTSSSSGSSSGSTSSSSSSSSSSTSSSSSSSSSGSSCPDTPCKLTTPQCGCAAGEACTIENYAVACGQPGPATINQACGTSASDQCLAGAICVGASATVGQCLEFCESDSDCQPFGGICAVTLADGPSSTTSIPGVTLCTPHCSLIAGTGCPSGANCDLGREGTGLMRWFGICGPVGTKTQGQVCNTTNNDCAPTYTCLDPDGTNGPASPMCLKYCDAGSITSCSGGLLCYGLQDQNSQPIVVDGVSIGVCDS